jgi:aryl-alcohol dehydrogenase-like predicted oxidoreductase
MDNVQPGDYRVNYPRFQAQNFQHNLGLVNRIEELAKRNGCTLAQLAISWVLARGEDIIPIPGTKKLTYLEENLAAADIKLSTRDMSELEKVVPAGAVAGARYTEQAMRSIDR